MRDNAEERYWQKVCDEMNVEVKDKLDGSVLVSLLEFFFSQRQFVL